MTRPGLQAIIGLEIHAQLMSKRKLFSCSLVPRPNAIPNSSVTYYDAAHPGTLPRLHTEPVRLAIRAGLALRGSVNHCSRFVRKHYFYGDMPAGYQITQHESPIVSNGMISLNDGTSVRIERIQLEQDSGKTVADLDPNFNFLDLNRAGVPLIEIVTSPDLNDSHRAVQTVKEIQQLLSYLEICDGVMANGNLRVDVNISMKNVQDPNASYHRVEVKNLNSLKSIGRAIDFEIERQSELIQNGGTIVPETRGFDASLGITQTLRSKELIKDYRMFNDPDLPALTLTSDFIEEIRRSLPELPKDGAVRLQSRYGIPPSVANTISSSREFVKYFEHVISIRLACSETATAAANWMVNELFGRLSASNIPFVLNPVKAKHFRDLIDMVLSGSVSGSAGKSILDILMEGESRTVAEIVAEKGWSLISDPFVLKTNCQKVIDGFPTEVSDYLVKGNKRKLNFLISEVRKLVGDGANMSTVKSVLVELLHDSTKHSLNR